MASSGMRKMFTGLLGFGLLLLASCAGSSSYMKPVAEHRPIPNDKAVVRFMRPSSWAPLNNVVVFDGETAIGHGVALRQFDYVAEPGRHLFIAASLNWDYLDADLAAGRVYYVIMRLAYGNGFVPRVYFEPVRRGSKSWDEVEVHEKSLRILSPDESALKTLRDDLAQDGRKMVSAYENDPKKAEYAKISQEDGR